VIPEENVRDLKEIPDNIKESLEIRPVSWIDQVLDIALAYQPEPRTLESTEQPEGGSPREDRKEGEERVKTH